MNIEDAQKQVDEWIQSHGVRYFDELTNMMQGLRLPKLWA